MKTISTRIEGRGTQFCDYIEHLKGSNTDKNRYKLVIHLGGYKVQSHGEVERWDGEKWHRVVTVHGTDLKTDVDAGYDYKRTLSERTFKADRDKLIALANEVVND